MEAPEGDASRALKEVVGRSYVLAYREDVTQLEEALSREGLNPTVLRAKYTALEATYARATRTFLAHHSAWLRAAEHDGYTLICEADFVPCVGVGAMPTFWPLSDPLAWGYLYQGSPRLLALIGRKPYLRGHCAPLVAYVVNAPVARVLCDFFHYEMGRHDPTQYFPFDAYLQWTAMGRNCSAFIPEKHYGEHGGLPNPEHREFGIRRAGQHRADNLAARLHFLPQYTRNSRFTFLKVRAHGRLLGLARLLTNRWIVGTETYHNGFVTKARMYAIGLKRLLF
jgi:hypothetical protein